MGYLWFGMGGWKLHTIMVGANRPCTSHALADTVPESWLKSLRYAPSRLDGDMRDIVIVTALSAGGGSSVTRRLSCAISHSTMRICTDLDSRRHLQSGEICIVMCNESSRRASSSHCTRGRTTTDGMLTGGELESLRTHSFFALSRVAKCHHVHPSFRFEQRVRLWRLPACIHIGSSIPWQSMQLPTIKLG
jgi:hypothetical protein